SQPITITVAVQFRLLMDTRKSINGWILEVNRLLSEILRHSLNPCPIIRTSRGSDSIAPRLGKGFSILVSRTSSLLTGEMRTPVSSSQHLQFDKNNPNRLACGRVAFLERPEK